MNYALAVKDFDSRMEKYVQNQIAEKKKRDELNDSLQKSLRKRQQKDTQQYQLKQIERKNNSIRSDIKNQKSLDKHLANDDLLKSQEIVKEEYTAKKLRQEKTRKMLDEQIRQARYYKESLSLDEKQYALNAARIKTVLNKY